MTERVRPYLYYDIAVSICSTCYRKVEGKIVFEGDDVWLDKRCPRHGRERVLLADDVDYYRRSREQFLKASEMPARFGTPVRWGCPYDCGLCADHEQHSCLSLVEITDACNLECPICYAGSSPQRQSYRSFAQVEAMLDAVVRAEGQPDVLQISGGEPTIHPDFFAILDAARARPIRHLMVNTNGVRISRDADFARRLADYMPGFELYLQWDSAKPAALQRLRGADLSRDRRQALERLNELGLSTTLVVTLERGTNTDEIGSIIDFALQQPCVRGVTFQPIQVAGRCEGHDPVARRLTLTEVRRLILEQTDVFAPADLIPVPCHPDSLAMGYAIKLGGKVVPLTGMIDPALLLEGGRNTIVYEQDDVVRKGILELFSTGKSPAASVARLRDLLCCLPRVRLPAGQAAEGLGYQNLFRVIIMAFMDAHNFDVRSVKKSCVHMVHPEDGRMIPFDTYNLFYRDDLEQTLLEPLRREAEAREEAAREAEANASATTPVAPASQQTLCLLVIGEAHVRS